ncbi:MAG: ABC transporter substrate-binding protein [Acidimicrobiia bacterium]|nr:ABC transporter substrate-binding protein [Acidimicrobiia bacterium]
MSKQLLRILSLLMALALVGAACGSDSSSDDGAAADDTAADDTAADDTAADDTAADDSAADDAMDDDAMADDGDVDPDAQLVIGTILPVTGDLAFLGPAEIAGAELAAQDINAAGGVFGKDLVLIQGDSGDTTTDTANVEVDRLLSEGADAIMGAASSAVSKTVIDKITGAGVIQFSPANTSPDFTTYDDNGLYFRTAPSDLLQGKVLADEVLAQGNETASVLFRQESYGTGLADAFRENFEAAGGTIDEFIPYAIDVESFDAEVDTIQSAGSDAILVIGFAESANIITTMHERGIGPTSDVNVWGVDGNAGINAEMSDPSILEGMSQTVPSVDLGSISDFIDRLNTEMGGEEETAYGAETYDSVVIVALAAAIAGSDGGTAIAAEINGVTKDGTKCTTFAECIALVEAGTDIDYDGLGGPYEFVDAGEPAAASFRVDTYGPDGADAALARYVFAS